MMLNRKVDETRSYIKYIASSKVTPSFHDNGSPYYFGAEYNDAESTWDSETGEGVLVFNGNITNIPSNAFEYTDLQLVTEIPESVIEINSWAFRGCRKLESFIIPNTIAHIGYYSFNTCTNLKEITIGENVIDFGGRDEINDGGGCFGLCYKLETVNWNAINCPDFIDTSNSPFSIDSMETSEVINTPIKNVIFGNNVKNIPSRLFYKCSNIEGTITIPSTCERIGERAFQGCTKLNVVICKALTPPSIEFANTDTSFGASDGNVVFRYYENGWKILPNLTIYVPEESIELYKNDANWSMYADRIFPIVEYNAIDLGLRTEDNKKILFADKNIGSTRPDVSGMYFQWGDVVGHTATIDTEEFNVKNTDDNYSFVWATYKYSNDDGSEITKYNSIDNIVHLESMDDPAYIHIGKEWRCPTYEELGLLMDENNFEIQFIDLDDNIITNTLNVGNVKGVKFISKISGFEGNNIMLPANGTGVENKVSTIYGTISVWSSTVNNNKNAKYVYGYINRDNGNPIINLSSKSEKRYGRQIRGIKIE